jgi:alpha-1,3-glucosyltransferase
MWVFICFKVSSSCIHKFNRRALIPLLCNPGIVFVDNIHFQYNAFMYGILLLAIGCLSRSWFVLGAIFFAVVLNFKHIYLYQAPAFFVFLLSAYCFKSKSFRIANFVALGLAVVSVFAVSFFPFRHHLLQIYSRLFPFKRGLCHAYWAPNVWALYSFADRLAVFSAKKIFNFDMGTSSLTRGLVGDSVFSVLPNVPPIATFVITILSQLPILHKLWNKPTFAVFMDALVLCSFGSFLFGWHVHEKAILLVLIPITFQMFDSPKRSRIVFVLSLAGYYSLFPLLYQPKEMITKVLILVLYTMMNFQIMMG